MICVSSRHGLEQRVVVCTCVQRHVVAYGVAQHLAFFRHHLDDVLIAHEFGYVPRLGVEYETVHAASTLVSVVNAYW